MTTVVGNCGKHPGQSMINCPLCEIENHKKTSRIKTPTELLQQSNEYTEALEFVMAYREDRGDFDGYISTSALAEMIVKHKNKFVDTDWYNAGIFAQRVLSNHEIESLTKRLVKEVKDHRQTKAEWDETAKELNELRGHVEALKDRIKIQNERLNNQ